jgi:hypothetical protein
MGARLRFCGSRMAALPLPGILVEVIELKYLELESNSSQHCRYFWRLPQEADGTAGCVRPDTSSCCKALAD